MSRAYRFPLVVMLCLALAPGLAEAKAGGGSSMGSRGSRTYQSNGARPIERSLTPLSPSTPRMDPAPSLAPQPAPSMMASGQPGFFQRHPFVGGMLGGFVGAGIGSMLFGGHFFGGGAGGILSVLIQAAVIFFLGRMIFSFFRRSDGGLLPQPAGGPAMGPRPVAPAGGGRGPLAFPLTEGDLNQIERLLSEIQAAWSSSDIAYLNRLMVPEIASYMAEQLDGNRRRGVVNRVEQVRLLKGDVKETWQENGLDFATVMLTWSAVDYLQRLDNGQLVEGDPARPQETTEVWTVVRRAGGPWQLTAIQQV